MKVLLQAAEADRDGRRLQTVIVKIFSGKDLEVLRTVDDLKMRLHFPLGQKAIVVLMASNVEELRKFLLLRDLMRNLSIVLVLPNYEPETLKMAHLLLPRYLEHKGNEFDDLAEVLTCLAG
jgi:hypothetical protein